MNPSIESLQLYFTGLTGLLLLLNLVLLMSIRSGIRWAQQSTSVLPEEERVVAWQKANRVFVMLIFTVILLNAAAIFASSKLRQSLEAVAAEVSGSNLMAGYESQDR